ncbi:MAG: YSC84-related protein [Achromobacter sp.]|jgi:lipid-binding SYLF domain-containing protein
MQKNRTTFRSSGIALALVAASLAFTGCTTTKPHDAATPATERAQINSGVDAALSKLYASAPTSRDLVSRAKGVLVFPSVVGASFVVGGEYGRGALRVDGKTTGYYSTTAGSIGFQAGAQDKSIIVLFMTQQSLDNFRNSNGWTVGADATVAVATIGANGSIDSNTIRQPIVGFVVNNTGLMAGVSLTGAKINKISP